MLLVVVRHQVGEGLVHKHWVAGPLVDGPYHICCVLDMLLQTPGKENNFASGAHLAHHSIIRGLISLSSC